MARKASLLLEFKRGVYDLLVDSPELSDVQILKRYPEGDEQNALRDDSLSFGGVRSTQSIAGIGPDKPRDELPAVGILVRVQKGGPFDDAGDDAETRLFAILDTLADVLHDAQLPIRVANLGIREIEQATDEAEFGAISYARAQIVAGISRLR